MGFKLLLVNIMLLGVCGEWENELSTFKWKIAQNMSPIFLDPDPATTPQV
jgi:hypothetical protein